MNYNSVFYPNQNYQLIIYKSEKTIIFDHQNIKQKNKLNGTQQPQLSAGF